MQRRDNVYMLLQLFGCCTDTQSCLDCIECMACSDNTIRAGLTPKFKDVDALCETLSYRMDRPDSNKLPPKPDPSDPHVTIYDPGVPELKLHRILVGTRTATFFGLGAISDGFSLGARTEVLSLVPASGLQPFASDLWQCVGEM